MVGDIGPLAGRLLSDKTFFLNIARQLSFIQTEHGSPHCSIFTAKVCTEVNTPYIICIHIYIAWLFV